MLSAQRVRTLLDRHGDWLFAAALTLVTQLEVWTINGSYLDAARLPFAVTTLVMTLALAWRRRAPLAMATAVARAVVAPTPPPPPPPPTPAPPLGLVVTAY